MQYVQIDLDHSARKRCRECGRLLSVRRFAIDLNYPDHRAPRCDECEEYTDA